METIELLWKDNVIQNVGFPTIDGRYNVVLKDEFGNKKEEKDTLGKLELIKNGNNLNKFIK